MPPVPTDLSEPLWLYDSQTKGETFNCILIHTVFIYERKKSSIFVGLQSVKANFSFFFPIFMGFFFQQNNKLHLSVTSNSFSSLYISDIIWNNEYHHSIFTKQFTKWIPTSTVEERIPIPFDSMFIPFFDMIQVSTHIEDKCRLTWISCPYAQMGCKKKVRTS